MAAALIGFQLLSAPLQAQLPKDLVLKADSPANDPAIVKALVAKEETCIKLAPSMMRLSKTMLDLRFPGVENQALFMPGAVITDLGPLPPLAPGAQDLTISRTWPVADKTTSLGSEGIWSSLLQGVSWFDHAKVFIVTGDHPNGDMHHFNSLGGFEALAKMKTGEWRSLNGSMSIAWERSKTPATDLEREWRITSWKTESMEWSASPKRFFLEVLDSALPKPEDLSRARHSLHQEATIKYYREGMKNPHPYFAPISANQKEGIAIVDLDGDGYDDIYVTVRLGKNMFFHNRGDGTFVEEAAAYGLDLPGHTTCALFADFDNDGDLDVILGRSLLKCTYLENRGGKFVQLPIPSFMPMAAISMAAADYNGDGLLDVYICTYRPAAPMGASPAGGVAQVSESSFDWPDEFFPPELAREYKKRESEHRRRIGGTVLDQLGPPNVLLLNKGGGRFEPAPENKTVGVFRNSLQATWCDYNQDGRPDLYIANDWAVDVLFRNDGPAGFTDVSTEAGITSYGFAMGATFGDYDNDGRDDLYVSNMYSAPGRRMTSRIPGISKMFIESAMGNWLYHQEANGKFTQVAGMQAPAMTVMNAGWSWGGCFADFNNDSFLDLYVLSGYFTAPKEISSDLDLESNLWRTMVRSDENLSRPSFRLSPEWKRTQPPDSLGPEIDARLAGVDRQGEKVFVHSLNGHERNHYFLNLGGKAFADVSGLSGLDNEADGRGFATFDYDRDGWQDVVLVNADEPLMNLYHNEMPAMGMKGGVIAIKFVGGSRSAMPTNGLACRDGFGARVNLDLGDQKITREHRCGEGWSTQNSPTMMVGIGGHTNVLALTVKWPSGKSSVAKDIPEGTFLTIYEDASQSPTKEAFAREMYRRPRKAALAAAANKPVFPLRQVDDRAKPAKLHVYTTFATSSASATNDLPRLWRLKEQAGPQGVDVTVVTVDPADDNARLGAYAQKWKPSSRLVNVPLNKRAEVLAAYTKAMGQDAPVPSTVITDDAGHVLLAEPALPNISAVRKLLDEGR